MDSKWGKGGGVDWETGIDIYIYIYTHTTVYKRFPGGTVVKNAGDARDTVSILGSGRSPGIGNGNSL